MIKGYLYSFLVAGVRVFATMLMVFVMAGHAIFGCCWHHDHASDVRSVECRAIVGHNECDHDSCDGVGHTGNGHEHQDGAKPLPSHNEPAPCPHHGSCDKTDCVFVRTDGEQNLNLSHSYSLVTMAVSEPSLLVSGVRGTNIPSWSHYHCGKPPLRPHLLLQILLI